MKRMFRPGISLLLPALVLLLEGCASYYTHYGVFEASNSVGEDRQFRVTWVTADYPSWWLAADQATPVRLETQCSSRVWELREEGDKQAKVSCGSGIRACAEPGRDILVATGQPAEKTAQCIRVTNAKRIGDIDREVDLVVACRPVRPNQEVQGETVNVDYLRASVVPYRIRVREAPRDSLSARPPELDDDVCDDG